MIYETEFEPIGELCGFSGAGENMKSKDRLTAAAVHEHADTQPSLCLKRLSIYWVCTQRARSSNFSPFAS